MSGTAISCITCSAALRGRQRKFCSLRCKNADTNSRHQNYRSQQQRGMRHKRGAIENAGGACVRCGYARNSAALVWHNRDPGRKRFSLDLRAFSNRTHSQLQAELAQCELLCANCHADVHFPQLTVRH